MKRKIVTLFASLTLIASIFAMSAGSAHAATHNSTNRAAPNTSAVNCLPSLSKVGLQMADEGWECFAGAGTANVGRVVVAVHPDAWSGVVYWRASADQSGPVSSIGFCDHVWFTIQQALGNRTQVFVLSIYLSPTREPWC